MLSENYRENAAKNIRLYTNWSFFDDVFRTERMTCHDSSQLQLNMKISDTIRELVLYNKQRSTSDIFHHIMQVNSNMQ